MTIPYYSDESVTLYHGDCRDVLPTLADQSIGGVVTSPPYNLGDMSGGHANLADGYASYEDRMPHAEYVTWQREILAECWRVVEDAGAIFYNHKPRIRDGVLWTPLDLNPGLPLRQIIIWARPFGVNWSETFLVPAHEWILLFAKSSFRITKATSSVSDVWRMTPATGLQRPDHPAPFPMGLPVRAVNILSGSTRGTVLDPFSGSGTTLRAARDAGHKAIGVEIDERYCEIAARRLDQGVLDFEAVGT